MVYKLSTLKLNRLHINGQQQQEISAYYFTASSLPAMTGACGREGLARGAGAIPTTLLAAQGRPKSDVRCSRGGPRVSECPERHNQTRIWCYFIVWIGITTATTSYPFALSPTVYPRQRQMQDVLRLSLGKLFGKPFASGQTD